MREKKRVVWALAVLGAVVAAAPARATGDEIEIDPTGGAVKVENRTTPAEGKHPGTSMTIREDVALNNYRLCYKAGSNPPKQASYVIVATHSLCDPSTINFISLHQDGPRIEVQVNGEMLNESAARRCKPTEPNRTCKGNGIPSDIWGPWLSFAVIDEYGVTVTGLPKVLLQPGNMCQ
jgi:hypothetical protein